MTTAPTAKRKITCEACGRSFSVLPGDGATVCKDKAKCEDRQRARGLKTPSLSAAQISASPPAAASTVFDSSEYGSDQPNFNQEPNLAEPAPLEALTPEIMSFVSSAELGSAEHIAGKQRSLAVRAIATSEKILDHIEDALNNGVQVVFKDGTSAMQSVQPMALSAMLRELRPIVQEPIRAAEAKDLSSRPLISLNLNDPEISRQAVEALRSRRERKLLAEAAPKD